MSNGLLAVANVPQLPLADGSVHCAVFSPPYWGLRKYAGEQGRVWGGDPDCVHEWVEETVRGQSGGHGDALPIQSNPSRVAVMFGKQTVGTCPKCGAWRGELGLEPTPEMHVAHTVAYMREIRRVLRDDGVCFLNYGDCYEGSGGENANSGLGMNTAETHGLYRANPRQEKAPQGNLMGMPHRIVLALQADGWIWRDTLHWIKPNPMPESVAGTRWQRKREKIKAQETNAIPEAMVGRHNVPGAHASKGTPEPAVWEYSDEFELRRSSWRHTSAVEYIFMLTKKMAYFCDQEAVREAAEYGRREWSSVDGNLASLGGGRGSATVRGGNPSAGRNPRNYVVLPTQSYPGAHYATYPEKLVEPLIKAACPERACSVCGAGWAPVVEKPIPPSKDTRTPGQHTPVGDGKLSGAKLQEWLNANPSNVLGYRPTCEHTEADPVPGIVLDPFVGSGTTALVAKRLGRRFVGFDISFEYLSEQAVERVNMRQPNLF